MWKCKCGAENSDSTLICESCSADISLQERLALIERKKTRERLDEENREIAKQDLDRKHFYEKMELTQKEFEDLDAFLKENGHEGYYEYKILNIVDENNGSIDIEYMYSQLNILGRQGWHLRCAFTNELGVNSSSFGAGAVSSGVNSTVDQSVLILERLIKFR